MRIVYVLTSLGMGGAERQVLALAARMVQRGHTVALLVLRPRLTEEWPTALDPIHLGMRRTGMSVLTGLSNGRKFLKSFHPDLVHSHSFHANLIARLLKVLVPSTVVLSTVHNVYEGGWQRMLAYRVTDALSTATTAVSQAVADRFVRLKGIPQKKCIVLTNGIDIGEFFPSRERRMRMRKQTGANGDFIWLATARVVPAKDYPNLLRAFAIVRAARPDVQLWICAVASPARFKRISGVVVKEERISMAQVRWLGLRRDLPALFDAADGFVLASAWEGMPLAVGEAMAMEKPVVATDVGGVRELAGECALLVPAKSPAALAESMLHLMDTSIGLRDAMGRAGRLRIQTSFSMDTKADEWENLYRSILVPAS